MFYRKNLILSTVLVLLLTAVLWPLTVFLQDHVDGVDGIQLEIEHMYADYDQHMHGLLKICAAKHSFRW